MRMATGLWARRVGVTTFEEPKLVTVYHNRVVNPNSHHVLDKQSFNKPSTAVQQSIDMPLSPDSKSSGILQFTW